MVLGRLALIILIYSSQIFLGTQPYILGLQLFSLLLATAFLATHAFTQRTSIFPPVFTGYLLLFIAYLGVSLILGLASAQTPPPIILRFLLNFLITFSMPLLAYSYSKLNILSNEKILRHILIATVIYSSFKMLIVIVFAVFDIPIVILPIAFQAIFNTTPTFDVIAFGVIRFMAPTDFLAPFVLYFSLVHTKGLTRTFLAVLLSTSIFVTFSRFIWIEGIFAIFAYLLSLSRGKILVVFLIGAVAIPIAAVWAPSSPIIARRFSSDATFSDAIRVKQYDALTRDMAEHLVIGHGPASFSYSVIRDSKSPYSYEMQWMAFIYQLGIAGLIFLLGLAAFNVAPLLEIPPSAAIPILFLYGVFLLSGFANPSLTGRSAGISFAFILCLTTLLRDKKITSQHTYPLWTHRP